MKIETRKLLTDKISVISYMQNLTIDCYIDLLSLTANLHI